MPNQSTTRRYCNSYHKPLQLRNYINFCVLNTRPRKHRTSTTSWSWRMRRLSSLWQSAPVDPPPPDSCCCCCCGSGRAEQDLRRCHWNWWRPADSIRSMMRWPGNVRRSARSGRKECTPENPCHCSGGGRSSSRGEEEQWWRRPRTTRNAQQLISSGTRSLIIMSLAYEYCDSWRTEGQSQ